MLELVLILFCSDPGGSRWLLLVPTVLLLLALAARKTSSKYADEVADAGDCLLVRRGSVQDRVQLSDISEVRGRGNDITLFLRKPGKFGSKIFFIAIRKPPTSWSWFRLHTDEDPSIRIDLSRRLNKFG